MNELLRSFSAECGQTFSATLSPGLHHSGEARKSAKFSSPVELLHNYLKENCGEARKTCFSASPYKEASLLEKVGLHRPAAPFGGLAA